ncbi:MAG: VanZ family protein [Gammaproteobacteria bacterium]
MMRRLFYKILFIVLLGVATYQSLTPHPADVFSGTQDKLLHFICWFTLSVSAYFAYMLERIKYNIWISLFVFSAAVETGQIFVEGRYFSIADIAANGMGCLIASTALIFVHSRYMVNSKLGD